MGVAFFKAKGVDMAQQNKSNQNSNSQVRGKDLRSKMIDSAEYGEQYRSDHQGQDVVENEVTKDIKTGSERPNENSRK
jgi:hypothetical protein